jgi:Zn-dependent protease with chaperone function
MYSLVKLYFLFFLSILTSFNFAQTSGIPKSYLSSYVSYYEKYLEHDVEDKYIEEYARDHAFTKFNYTFYHKIYYDQPVLVSYIRSILQKIETDRTKADGLDIYITRSTEFNAFTIADGSMFVNIAAIAQMTSEAELAFLIAHEYGHYKLLHVKKNYLNSRKQGSPSNHRELQQQRDFSQNNELEADSLAYVLATSAGYDPRAMDILMQRLIFLQKKGSLMSNTSYNQHDVIPTTHPVGEARLDQIKMMSLKKSDASLYPNGKERFEQIKHLAEFEYLKLLDESFDIHNMISYPLKRYLLTGDEVYLPTLIRGIRKLLLLKPELNKEAFMTTHFANRESRFAKNENLIHHLYNEYPDSAELNLMHNKSVINFNRVPFQTFEQAFTYFSTVAIDAGFEEPILDKALYYGLKTAIGKAALNDYLKNENNLYYDYATQLKTKNAHEVLENGEEIILLGGFHKYVFKQGWNFRNNIDEFKNRNEFLMGMRTQYLKRELEYKIYNYEDFVQENPFGVHLSTIEQLVYGGYGKDIMDFDPRLFYAFKQSNIKSVEYLSLNSYNFTNRKFNRLLYLPPVTPYILYYGFINRFKVSQFLSESNCYRFLHNGDEWIGQVNKSIKRSYMSNKRAQRVLYRIDRNTRRGYTLILGFIQLVYK